MTRMYYISHDGFEGWCCNLFVAATNPDEAKEKWEEYCKKEWSDQAIDPTSIVRVWTVPSVAELEPTEDIPDWGTIDCKTFSLDPSDN